MRQGGGHKHLDRLNFAIWNWFWFTAASYDADHARCFQDRESVFPGETSKAETREEWDVNFFFSTFPLIKEFHHRRKGLNPLPGYQVPDMLFVAEPCPECIPKMMILWVDITSWQCSALSLTGINLK